MRRPEGTTGKDELNMHVDVWTCSRTQYRTIHTIYMWTYGHAIRHSTVQYTQYTCGRMDMQYDTVPYNTHNMHVDVWTCSTTQYHTIHTICMWTYGRAVRHSTIQYTQYICGRMDMQYDTVPYNTHDIHALNWAMWNQSRQTPRQRPTLS